MLLFFIRRIVIVTQNIVKNSLIVFWVYVFMYFIKLLDIQEQIDHWNIVSILEQERNYIVTEFQDVIKFVIIFLDSLVIFLTQISSEVKNIFLTHFFKTNLSCSLPIKFQRSSFIIFIQGNRNERKEIS